MEFLFTAQSASIEAILMFACIFVIFALFAYDGYLYIVGVIQALHPRKAYVKENATPTEEPSVGAENLDTMTPDILPEIGEESIVSKEELQLESPFLMTEEEGKKTIETLPTTEILSKEESPVTLEGLLPETSSPLLEGIGQTPQTETITIVEELIPEAVAPIEIHDEVTIQNNLATESIQEEVYDDTLLIGKESPIEETKIETLLMPEKVVHLPSKKATDVPNSKTSPEKKEKLIEIVSMVRTLIARGHIDEARTFIINGLAIEKDHRELNLLMASLFEREHAYEKAEYIFKDLAHTYPDDAEILIHLATSLAMQRKYEVAYELYKKILSLQGEDEETLYTLTHLASELSLPEDVYLYGKAYLKQYPRNPEILWLYSQSLITKGERREAIEVLIKLKNLTPYNQEIVDLIGKLVTEEELAGNFGGEKN